MLDIIQIVFSLSSEYDLKSSRTWNGQYVVLMMEDSGERECKDAEILLSAKMEKLPKAWPNRVAQIRKPANAREDFIFGTR